MTIILQVIIAVLVCVTKQPCAAFICVPSTTSSSVAQLNNFRIPQTSRLHSTKVNKEEDEVAIDVAKTNLVLVAGFESFNKDLYTEAAQENLHSVNMKVFADNEIHSSPTQINPIFEEAMKHADIFVGSLIFDYDDASAVESLLHYVKGPKLLFECSTELMVYNEIGSFSMKPKEGEVAGPPKVVKEILSKFTSGKEEDKIAGYMKMLKIGPTLLNLVPGEKARDLKTWLNAYRYWNQGGTKNVQSMVDLLRKWYTHKDIRNNSELLVTPDVGLVHPLHEGYFASPKEYLSWRHSKSCDERAALEGFSLAHKDAPCCAILLYRKHVITEQRYIMDLITQMEANGVCPVPVFINGVEGHTIVRDLLTSEHEIKGVRDRTIVRSDSFQEDSAVAVDCIVSTIGFPLVGGPAGSFEAGRNVVVAEQLLRDMDVPYIIASPLLLQSISQWKQNGVLGLQSVVLYSLPELDGAVDTVILGGLVGDKIALVPERVRKLTSRIKGWVQLRKTPKQDRKIAIVLYGFPPNVGAVGTAALLDVPGSLDNLLKRMHAEGYNVGDFATDQDACGESIVAALSILNEDAVISAGTEKMREALDSRIERAVKGIQPTPETLAKPHAGLGGANIRALTVSNDELEAVMGKYMWTKVRRAWPEKERGPGISSNGEMVVSGMQLGNVWVTVQPLLGVEGDPMRLLFQRDLTPHPQYCASYEYMKLPEDQGGIGAHSVIHLGMHGTLEWLPGKSLGNDRQSWSDELIGGLPNIYAYAANNPSESILAKRRAYGTLVSYNVPPYGRAGLYLELANLKDLLTEYRTSKSKDLRQPVFSSCQRCGIESEIPLLMNDKSVFDGSDLPDSISSDVFDEWVVSVSNYLELLQERLFSSGLHILGSKPSKDDLKGYLSAFFGDSLSEDDYELVLEKSRLQESENQMDWHFPKWIENMAHSLGIGIIKETESKNEKEGKIDEAIGIVSLLLKTTEELDSILTGLDGGYIPPKPGGDLLRDGTSVLPTGRNIHALDPYRMPAEGAWIRGQNIAKETLSQHLKESNGVYPETIACTLWGLDTIKTRGESIAIVLALVGAYPVKEGTGRVVRYDLMPLDELERPRIDVLASLSGIFRDSFANVVDLLDDMFERLAKADEPIEMNYIKKHALELENDGIERSAARLFSNPPGDYGSMVNEVVGTGDWEESNTLGDTWKGRNVFSYGRNEGIGKANSGTARPEILDKLLATTERVVQEIDSVEYGLTDIQEYYSNTGALKVAAENQKPVGSNKKVVVSIVEAFGSPSDSDTSTPVRNVEDVLRLEYRSKLLNPKWRDAMLAQGSGGAYEVSQRMTALIGWGATTNVDQFVFDQAAERYALDEDVASKLQKANPQAFKNVIRRLLEANGRGMWESNSDTLQKLRELYADADDLIEQVDSLY